MIPTPLARWLWLALIALQLAWFGWLHPSTLLGYWPALVIATVPLLLPTPWILALRPQAMVVGGMILLLHFSFAVGEAWVNPATRAIASVQIALIVLYFLALPSVRRRRAAETRDADAADGGR